MGLQDTKIKQFPRITKQKALEIAAQMCMRNIGEFKCYSKKPESCRIYGINPADPCWYVYPPQDDEQAVLRSSRVIVISRVNGEIIYDGSAGDEG